MSEAPSATNRNDALLQTYLASNSTYLLNLGCGWNRKPGWLNCDIDTRGQDDVFQMDATVKFPFHSNTFRHVFSEHVIEHFDYDRGQAMLTEARRVMKPGGVIRIATPSIGFLIGLFSHDRSQLADQYIESQCKKFYKDVPRVLPGFVFNTFVRAWGHTFIYDRQTLRLALEQAGFLNIREMTIQQSSYSALQNLESVSQIFKGFIELETMIFEAESPQ